MSDAKTAMLARIRAALRQAAPAPEVPRGYQHNDACPRSVLVAELVERLMDYKAQVSWVSEADVPQAIAAACVRYGLASLALPPDIPADWVPAGVMGRRDAPPLSHTALEACAGVLTGCALAIAQTGTLVLDGGPTPGRRALSLVPDVHLCMVREAQVVGSVPEGIARLGAYPTRPLTFISGPSATSDIELSRVEGVHGPSTLHILLLSSPLR